MVFRLGLFPFFFHFQTHLTLTRAQRKSQSLALAACGLGVFGSGRRKEEIQVTFDVFYERTRGSNVTWISQRARFLFSVIACLWPGVLLCDAKNKRPKTKLAITGENVLAGFLNFIALFSFDWQINSFQIIWPKENKQSDKVEEPFFLLTT